MAAADDEIRPLLQEQNTDYARLRISVGWPRGRRGGIGSHACGECWPADLSADGTNEIFISPELDDPLEVLALLAHHLIHACLADGTGHGTAFTRVSHALGLEGPSHATCAGDYFRSCAEGMLDRLGDYPHAALNDSARVKQTTRLLKCYCRSCGYTARITNKWVMQGLPQCPCGCGDRWTT